MNFNDGMNLNSFQPTQPGMFTADYRGAESSALLYLFSPRHMVDHYKRPAVYNFSNTFMNTMYDDLYNHLGHNASIPKNVVLDSLYSNQATKEIVLPAATGGIDVNTSLLSDTWTFLLIVTNDTINLSSMHKPKVDNRVIYQGYCTEEPINPTNLGNGHTVNDGSFLIITHKTVINIVTTHGVNGPITRYDTISDVDVIPGHDLTNLSQQSMFMNRPGDIKNATSVSAEDGTITAALTENDILGNKSDNIAMSGILNLPKQHGKKILKSIFTGCEEAASDAYSGALSNFGQYADTMGEDMVSSFMTPHMVDYVNEEQVGVASSRPVSMGEISQKYSPKVIPVIVTNNDMFSPVPQNQQSTQNIYSSMIASSVPTILSNIGLASISMMYHSPNQACKILDASSYMPMGQNNLEMLVKIVINQLQYEVFDLIVSIAGDFDLNMSVSCSGDTHIILNMLNGTQHQDIYEHHNCLGGLGNPLSADYDIVYNNSIKLGGLVSAITTDLT